MKKYKFGIFLISFLSLGLLTGCNDNKSSSSISEECEIVCTELPKSIFAELGEKCNIPEFSVRCGNEEIPFSVVVKDINDNNVDLLGRGTRFFASLFSNYKIIYSYNHKGQEYQQIIDVIVSDTSGPEIKLPISAYNMSVDLNDLVVLPVPEISDASGEECELSISVTKNGVPVQITDNKFLADSYGDYHVLYEAKDNLNNISRVEIQIECAKKILLEGFENYDNVWAEQMYSEITEDHAKHGKCLRVQSDDSWTMLTVYPKYYDLSGFDKLTLSIYSDVDMNVSDEGFYLLNKCYQLEKGDNTIVITKEDLNAMYPGGTIPSENARYYDLNYLWFQVRCAGTGNVWVDDFNGVFTVRDSDTSKPTIDVGRVAPHGKMNVNEGMKITIPNAYAYDDSFENITVTHKVYSKNKTDITASVDNGSYLAQKGEEYTIVYSASDSSKNETTKTINVSVIDKCNLPDISASDYFPSNRDYDMLQDFENGGIDFSVITNQYVEEHSLFGSKSAMFSTPNSDTCNVIKMVRNGAVLTEEMWLEYEYIQAYVYCDTLNSRFDFYGHTFNLNPGPNILKITSQDLVAEIKKASNVYDAFGGFYCQVTNGTIYVDSIIGVYPDGYHKKTFLEEYLGDNYVMLQDFEGSGIKDVAAHTTFEYVEDHHLTGEKSVKLSTSDSWQKVDIFLLNNGKVLSHKDFEALSKVKVFIYSENSNAKFCFLNKIYELSAGLNVVSISSADLLTQIDSNSSCYTSDGAFYFQLCTGTIYVDSIIGVTNGDFNSDEQIGSSYFPEGKSYDILQDFETEVCDSNATLSLSDEHVKCGQKSLKVESPVDWCRLNVPLKKNGTSLTLDDWSMYETIKIYIYSDKANYIWAYNHQIGLTQGENIIEIQINDWKSQINDSSYSGGKFWFQTMTGTLYIDAIIGITK